MQLDIRLGKLFPFKGFVLKGYVYVHNLLNRKNIINVYYRSGSADDDGYFTDENFNITIEGAARMYGENHVLLYEYVNLNHRQHYWRTQGGDLFGHPREIRFGLEVAF